MEYLANHPDDKYNGNFKIGRFMCSVDYTKPDLKPIKDWLEEIIKEEGLEPFEINGNKMYDIGVYNISMWILVIGKRYYYISC
ncbi:MAG: hypothetical protein RSE25_04730 [Bacteroidales bacterium]